MTALNKKTDKKEINQYDREYEFWRLSGGGALEQWDGLVNLDHGTLYVDGDYILHCNGILQMIQEDDLLWVKGGFETQSFMNYSSMLRNGRIGIRMSFTASEFSTMAFLGSRTHQAHFMEKKGKDKYFANMVILDQMYYNRNGVVKKGD